MKKLLPHVPPKYLLLIAGIVWMIAGGNVLKIGFTDFMSNWHEQLIYVAGVLLVFILFMLIFSRLATKHNCRIASIEEEKVPFIHFFDKKSYLIMIFMITGGLLIRSAHVLPAIAIGVIYSGIGLALEGAGILFLKNFIFDQGGQNLC